eukprot:CAMPEP_0115320072 /NCGR_PEP_ID=MMETSP0270-20121206/80122_1 /TAXON_ID=71861 /ORGANISM="Scrippsiella trochoidea, Strain CCMP3099" /LENGTH=85 /DNA_ID=CAMNT_0002739843 /DNA_START=84 /DNA_END=341 /DNA_ORIENTATION=-
MSNDQEASQIRTMDRVMSLCMFGIIRAILHHATAKYATCQPATMQGLLTTTLLRMRQKRKVDERNMRVDGVSAGQSQMHQNDHEE